MKPRYPSAVRSGVEAALHPMAWLVRYARHCGFPASNEAPVATQLRQYFGAAAWRVVCRSSRSAFLPILRNRELDLDSLIAYCQELARRSFVRAPNPALLQYFVTQRRLYFTRKCRAPDGPDYDIMRIANREAHVSLSEIALVTNWHARSGAHLGSRVRWKTLVNRARMDAEHEATKARHAQDVPWYFYCREVAWRGMTMRPLVNRSDLWGEGANMRSCLYDLARACEALPFSRFFSVSRGGRRVATLELALAPPAPGFIGMDRELGRWFVKDLRLAYNRLPGAELVASMTSFAKMYNEWAKRPRRWPWMHAEDLREYLVEGRRRERRVGQWDAVFQALLAEGTTQPASTPAERASGSPSSHQSTSPPTVVPRRERLTLSREEMEAAARARGFRIAGPDHPVYREGPTVVFASSSRSLMDRKIVDLPYGDLSEESKSPPGPQPAAGRRSDYSGA